MAIADHPDRHLRQFVAGEIGAVEIAAPVAPPQRVMTPGDQAGQREDGADGEFRDRAGIASWRVDDLAAARARRRDVDVEGATSGDRDEFEPWEAVHHRG